MTLEKCKNKQNLNHKSTKPKSPIPILNTMNQARREPGNWIKADQTIKGNKIAQALEEERRKTAILKYNNEVSYHNEVSNTMNQAKIEPGKWINVDQTIKANKIAQALEEERRKTAILKYNKFKLPKDNQQQETPTQ
eukprot:136175_1